ncbi:hypothetical protein [Bacillus stercoris]
MNHVISFYKVRVLRSGILDGPKEWENSENERTFGEADMLTFPCE